ncbi:hypothetical protein GTA51_13060 [Desulfovibrio aerotolerans]|uniref:Uncharacterized protein n=1 Tax=Solidesulfovibrio aerotolerans TaxID=295255 RepID=A0A7C9JA49_9BACT|nr:hypothetical protein [Solidesulfovibrio aerotolerans]MYL84058.1 hypothetical protein [Solidesulfovibrio aerotolerans]
MTTNPIHFDLSYIESRNIKADKNLNALNMIITNLNNASDYDEEARCVRKVQIQFDIIGRRDKETRTYGWARVGELLTHVRERFEAERPLDGQVQSWDKFAAEQFPKIKETRRRQAQNLYAFEKYSPVIVKLYYLGIDTLLPLYMALNTYHKKGELVSLLDQFGIDLKTKAKSKEELTELSKKISDLTKYLNTRFSVGSIVYDKELMYRANKVGCVFDDNDIDYMRSLGGEQEINAYLRRCIANKGLNRTGKIQPLYCESIHCTLSKLVETVYAYYSDPSKIPSKLAADRVDEAIECLQYLSSEIKKAGSR